MNIHQDITQLVREFGSWCYVQCPNEQGTRKVLMVVQATGSATSTGRRDAMAFIDKDSMPRGADWAYGLILACDAPENMTTTTHLTVTENTGAVWDVEAAKGFFSIDPETSDKSLVAWRLVMRGKQRMIRGR